MTNKSSITIGGLPMELIIKPTLKNMYLRVYPPDGIITISAPSGTSDETIRNFALRRLPEISKIRSKMLSQPRQSKREYISGEACYLWGKPYMLQIIYEGHQYKINKTANKILMTVPVGATEDNRKKALTEWYRSELKRILPSVLEECENKIGVTACSCSIKYMRTRWGSCNIDKGHITVNLQLVKKPVECLEYVLTHELVHLIEANHTNHFHMLVEKYCPNWKDAKQLLQEMPLDHLEPGETDNDNTTNIQPGI